MKRSSCAWRIVLALLLICMASAASGANITYTYDGAGRLTSADYGGGKAITYTYDNNGNLLQQVTGALNIAAADCCSIGPSEIFQRCCRPPRLH